MSPGNFGRNLKGPEQSCNKVSVGTLDRRNKVSTYLFPGPTLSLIVFRVSVPGDPGDFSCLNTYFVEL